MNTNDGRQVLCASIARSLISVLPKNLKTFSSSVWQISKISSWTCLLWGNHLVGEIYERLCVCLCWSQVDLIMQWIVGYLFNYAFNPTNWLIRVIRNIIDCPQRNLHSSQIRSLQGWKRGSSGSIQVTQHTVERLYELVKVNQFTRPNIGKNLLLRNASRRHIISRITGTLAGVRISYYWKYNLILKWKESKLNWLIKTTIHNPEFFCCSQMSLNQRQKC